MVAMLNCVPMDHILRAADAVGGQAKLAGLLGVTPPTVNQWAKGTRPVPIVHCVAIERATAGAVTRRDLRPDDAHLIWPDLDDADPNPAPALAQQAQAAINGVAFGEGA